MNSWREAYLKQKEKDAAELFEKIKNNPTPDIYDLWLLPENLFIEWRKLHDFPKLLQHFDVKLLLFKEWKQDNNLTSELIIGTGKITPFLEHKKLSKNKKLYLVEQEYKNKKTVFVSNKKLNGEEFYFEEKYKFRTLLEFYSYQDWLKQRQKKQDILYINSRHSPNYDEERVFIHADVYSNKSDFELLKMGGIEAPVNGFGILMRGKNLEFVNLCGLKLRGRISFGEEGSLKCSYCACDNLHIEDLDMPLLTFSHCSITNLHINNSNISNWKFYDCEVEGEILNTQIHNTRIWGGKFEPILKDCIIYNVHIEEENVLPDNNLFAKRLLKKTYADQGDDDIAIKYYIKEREVIRKLSSGFRYLKKTISYYYWGYGRKPHRVIWTSIVLILIFTCSYYFNKESILLANGSTDIMLSFGDCLYFSTTTFTTLGYGDYNPTGIIRTVSRIESFLGLINIGFLVAGYTSNKY